MKLTEEDFNEWRGSRGTEMIFALLSQHAVAIEEKAKDVAWLDSEPYEGFMIACRSEVKILTQLVTMEYADFVAISEADKDE